MAKFLISLALVACILIHSFIPAVNGAPRPQEDAEDPPTGEDAGKPKDGEGAATPADGESPEGKDPDEESNPDNGGGGEEVDPDYQQPDEVPPPRMVPREMSSASAPQAFMVPFLVATALLWLSRDGLIVY